jgi:hypothetical protein
MKTYCRILLPGILALSVSGTALAHNTVSPGYSGWSGNATVWIDPYGQPGIAGSIGYPTGRVYAPVYMPRPGYGYGPRFYHGPPYGHAKGYKHGYGHGPRHRHKHHRGHH